MRVGPWAAETTGIGQEKGGLKTQRNDNQARERVWVIAQSMSISCMQGGSPEQ